MYKHVEAIKAACLIIVNHQLNNLFFCVYCPPFDVRHVYGAMSLASFSLTALYFWGQCSIVSRLGYQDCLDDVVA